MNEMTAHVKHSGWLGLGLRLSKLAVRFDIWEV